MKEEVRVIMLEDRDEWIWETRAFSFPSQSWSYAHGLSASGVNPQLAVVRTEDARMVLPFYERSWRGTVDISTIVGGCGASIFPASTAPLVLWREFAASSGWVAGYLQLSSSVAFADPPGSEFICNNTDFIIDLRLENFIQFASRTLRTKVRDAIRAGATLVDDRRLLSHRFQELYPAAMRRLGASSHFVFSEETLRRWTLDKDSVILGAAVNQSVESIWIFRIAAPIAEASIMASTESGRYLSPWLICQAASRLRGLGVDLLNLGGGLRAGDELYQWKERFHPIRRPRWVARQIYDAAKYQELCRVAGVCPDGSWFPPYRAVS